jgi:hypothetical protein
VPCGAAKEGAKFKRRREVQKNFAAATMADFFLETIYCLGTLPKTGLLWHTSLAHFQKPDFHGTLLAHFHCPHPGPR